MEILTREKYTEFEEFNKSHPNGNIMQSIAWHGVKSGWDNAVVVSRGQDGRIAGGVSLLIQRVPLLGVSLIYAPRGPVCNLHDRKVLADLKAGVDRLAKTKRAYTFKIDPDTSAEDAEFIANAKEMGFKAFLGGDGFETIQPRFNYRVYLEGRDEDALFAGLTQKTRYNVRVARKHGVEVFAYSCKSGEGVGHLDVRGGSELDEFVRLMAITGKRDGFSVRPRGYFEGMLSSLGGNCRLYLAYYQGQAVAGAITSNYAGKCCYLYGASDNSHRNVMPTYLIQWEMMRWAAATGCDVYDFQGVSGNFEEADNPLYGLYRFKKGFGGRVDEGAGEFDFIYMPLRAKLVSILISLNEWRRKRFGRK